MNFYTLLLVMVLTHTCFKGSKVLVTLFAIELGATPFLIGVLFAMYSVFPAFLSLYAGRVFDRIGSRWPMLLGSSGLLVGLLLPYYVPTLTGLFFSATLIGLCYIFYIVAIQSLVGAIADGAQRTRNYSLFSIGVGLTTLIGPTTTGFSIEAFGHRETYLVLAVFPIVPILIFVAMSKLMPATAAGPRRSKRVAR